MTVGVHRLRDLPLPGRVLVTGFLLAVAAGYVAAQLNLRLTHGGLDGESGLSYDDVVYAFHGRPGQSVLTSKIDGGSMERYIPRPADRAVLMDWVEGGAVESDFTASGEVLDRLCVRCHHPGGEMRHVPFAESRAEGPRFDLVVPTTAPDTGMSWAALARSTHAHLFGMGTLFLLAGGVFLMTDAGSRTKAVVVAAPFVAMFVDIGCWWLTKVSTSFAGGVIAGGALMGLAFAILILRPLYEAWTPSRGPESS